MFCCVLGVNCIIRKTILGSFVRFMVLPLVTRCGRTLASVDSLRRECVESWRSPIGDMHWEKFLKIYPAERQAFFLDDKCLEFSVLQKKKRVLTPGLSAFCHVGNLSCEKKRPSGTNAVISQRRHYSLPLPLPLYLWMANCSDDRFGKTVSGDKSSGSSSMLVIWRFLCILLHD